MQADGPDPPGGLPGPGGGQNVQTESKDRLERAPRRPDQRLKAWHSYAGDAVPASQLARHPPYGRQDMDVLVAVQMRRPVPGCDHTLDLRLELAANLARADPPRQHARGKVAVGRDEP